MKKNKYLIISISVLVIGFISCQEKRIHIPDISTKDMNGNIQILVSTPSQNKNLIAFDSVSQQFIKTEKKYSLNSIANTGYIAGKKALHQAIVLGETSKTGSIVSTTPIALARLKTEKQTIDWHVYADINSNITNFEDFVLNHRELKNKLQHKFQIPDGTLESKLIWYDEDFLEWKINQAL